MGRIGSFFRGLGGKAKLAGGRARETARRAREAAPPVVSAAAKKTKEAAGGLMSGLASRYRDYKIKKSYSQESKGRGFTGAKIRGPNNLTFLIFLILAFLSHYFIEVRIVDYWGPTNITFRLTMHAIFAFFLLPFLLNFKFNGDWGPKFTVMLAAFFIPAILNLVAKFFAMTGVNTVATGVIYLTNIFFVPVWLIYAAFQDRNTPEFQDFLVMLFFLFWIFVIVTSLPKLEIYDRLGLDVTPEMKEQLQEAIKEDLPARGQKFMQDVWSGIKGAIEQPIIAAVGEDYYVGRVEKNKEEPLGVYLTNLKPAAQTFYEDESVIAWGTLKARTLQNDKPIDVTLSCYAKDYAQTTYGLEGLEIKGFTDVSNVRSMKETKKYEIFDFEQVDVDCRFSPGALTKGSHGVAFNALFDFDTDSYLKFYFMEQGKMRAISRQGINPLEQFGIIDKNPIAIFTQGPVGIGMEATKSEFGSLLGVTQGQSFRLGVTIENKWDGQIKKLKYLTLKIPDSLEIDPGTCDAVIYRDSCGKDTRGEDECEGGKYRYVYRLAKESEETPYMKRRGMDEIVDIKDFKSFNCRVNIKPGASYLADFLGQTPIATRYFKVSVGYEYELEKTINVQVKGVPGMASIAALTSVFPLTGSEANTINYVWRTYSNEITQASSTYGIPKSLIVAIIYTESSGDPNAQGPLIPGGRALGLMQIMPDTAKQYCGITDSQRLFDPVTNINCGTSKIKNLLGRYSNDYSQMLIAYNGGRIDTFLRDGSYQKWVDSGKPCCSFNCKSAGCMDNVDRSKIVNEILINQNCPCQSQNYYNKVISLQKEAAKIIGE